MAKRWKTVHWFGDNPLGRKHYYRKIVDIWPDKKVCRRCGKRKWASEFYTNEKAKDGLFSYCKECSAQGANFTQWKKKREEKYKEYVRKRESNNL